MKEIDELLETMRILRDPVSGCPWDREQTMQSILAYTLEEVYELADAIEYQNMREVLDELGDLLFHICFYAQIASESGKFDFRQIAGNINNKLQARHPHVFSTDEINSIRDQSLNWEHIKHAERRQRDPGASLLDAINPAQPAISRAYTLQKRAAAVGFDWPGPAPVFDKITEELEELKQAMVTDAAHQAIVDELGDVMFACVNLARHANINPESALRSSNRKFEQRFRYIEHQLRIQDKEWSDVSIVEMEALWQEAKSIAGGGDGGQGQ